MHVRPAAQFVKAARMFDADITVTANGRRASATSLLGLQMLGLTRGTRVTLSAEGPQAVPAVDHLIALLDRAVPSERGG